MSEYATQVREAFDASRGLFEALVAELAGQDCAGATHGELEEQLMVRSRELMCQLLQDHLDLRAQREQRLAEVVDAQQVPRGAVETGHTRGLATVFGQVRVERMAYRHRGRANLYPVDGQLNLPAEKYSHGLRKLAAIEAARGSFDEARAGIERVTGQLVGKRQVEELAVRAAVDVEDFYTQRAPTAGAQRDVLVLSADGKGVVMRPDALRPAAAKAASGTKLATRLSKGEKRSRKRMAEVGAVFDVEPVVREPADILTRGQDTDDAEDVDAPVATNKWLTASLTADTATVIGRLFDQAERRDPDHRRTWIALVDGNNHQIDLITAEAARRGIQITILCDFIHVLEYLWKAAWSFYTEGDPAAEQWVRDTATAILQGNTTDVAASIARTATHRGPDPPARTGADACATYLTNKAVYLDYPTALHNGWPIATGVIEGACRHLVKDRMDITGARWGLTGAEAILKLRALRSNGHLDEYWHYHLTRERQRIHEARYRDQIIPQAA